MQTKTEKDNTTDPDLYRNATQYIYNHKHRDAIEIELHFINIKELKYSYIQNGNRLGWVMATYL